MTKHKYNVDTSPSGKARRTHRRHIYDSQKECQHAIWLDSELAAGRTTRWEPQCRVNLEWGSQRIRPFGGKRDSAVVIDFLVNYPDGHQEFHEVKGMIRDSLPVTRLWRLKLGIVALMYPDIPINLY